MFDIPIVGIDDSWRVQETNVKLLQRHVGILGYGLHGRFLVVEHILVVVNVIALLAHHIKDNTCAIIAVVNIVDRQIRFGDKLPRLIGGRLDTVPYQLPVNVMLRVHEVLDKLNECGLARLCFPEQQDRVFSVLWSDNGLEACPWLFFHTMCSRMYSRGIEVL